MATKHSGVWTRHSEIPSCVSVLMRPETRKEGNPENNSSKQTIALPAGGLLSVSAQPTTAFVFFHPPYRPLSTKTVARADLNWIKLNEIHLDLNPGVFLKRSYEQKQAACATQKHFVHVVHNNSGVV